MAELEHRHVDQLAKRLLDEEKSPQAAIAMAERLAAMAKGHGRDAWLMVAAELRTTHAQVQQA